MKNVCISKHKSNVHLNSEQFPKNSFKSQQKYLPIRFVGVFLNILLTHSLYCLFVSLLAINCGNSNNLSMVLLYTINKRLSSAIINRYRWDECQKFAIGWFVQFRFTLNFGYFWFYFIRRWFIDSFFFSH